MAFSTIQGFRCGCLEKAAASSLCVIAGAGCFGAVEHFRPADGRLGGLVDVVQGHGVQFDAGVLGMPPPRNARQQPGNAGQIAVEMVIGQPIEFAQLQMRIFVVAMGPLHVLGVLDELPLLVFPIALFFQQFAVAA